MERLELERILRRMRAAAKISAGRTTERRLAAYNTGDKVHKKQLEFHRSLKRNRWVFGGNRTGKTECGAVEAVWMARGIHPYRENRENVTGWVVSLSYEVQRDVAQQKLLKYLPPAWIDDIVMVKGSKDSAEMGIIDFLTVKNVFGGTSKICFKSCDQGREKFQGASLDFVWFDEEPPEDIYEECRMRVLDKKGDVFGTMTPLKGLTWVYDRIYLNDRQDDEVFYITMEWADNPYLDAEEVKRLSATLSADSLDSRRYGLFQAASGLVYPEFSEEIHVIDPFPIPFDWQDRASIDPGLKNPLSCHFYAVDYDGNVYVVAEHYEKEKDIDWHARRILETADSIGWHRDFSGRVEALIDSAASQRTLAATKSVAELFYEKGIAVDTNVNKELFSGIMRVRDRFQARPPSIFIFRNCVNLIREIKGYRWGAGDAPVKKDDHALDELRYYLCSRPHRDAPKTKPDIYARHKENMARRASRKNVRR